MTGSPSIDGSPSCAPCRLGSPAMAEIATVRAAVGDHRDELIALVRALVSHPSENPKLLAEAGAQAAGDRGGGGLPGCDFRRARRARLSDRPLRGAARTRRRRRPAGRCRRRTFTDPQRARRRRAGRRRVCVAARSVGRRARRRQPLGSGRMRHEGRHRLRHRRPANPAGAGRAPRGRRRVPVGRRRGDRRSGNPCGADARARRRCRHRARADGARPS